MASSMEVVDCKNNEKKHEVLADFIKNVHSTLRKDLHKAHGDFHSVWQKHCADEVLLKQYAEAMKELAVEHWGGNNLRRIEWCKNVCVEYFHEAGYEKCLRKDCRRVLKSLSQHKNCSCIDEAEKWQEHLLSPRDTVKQDKLILLDVGSCFNPFQAFPEIFIPVAIDLCPGDESVYKCDFLGLSICSQEEMNSKSHAAVGSGCFPEMIQACISGSKIEQLPGDFFNVVVFCLLLSYLPASEQRWNCCKKAHELLMDGGLLLIITPDSSHQNKNVGIIKSWKAAIESIGFARWKYHKDDHTHCMAFRKKVICSNPLQQEQNVNHFLQILCIHQDFKEEIEEEEHVSSSTRQSDEVDLSDGFSALPFSF